MSVNKRSNKGTPPPWMINDINGRKPNGAGDRAPLPPPLSPSDGDRQHRPGRPGRSPMQGPDSFELSLI